VPYTTLFRSHSTQSPSSSVQTDPLYTAPMTITTPLSLPVAASRLTLSTQHMIRVVKSLWVVRIRLLLTHTCHLSVPLRERETSLCCVWVQCELTGIYR